MAVRATTESPGSEAYAFSYLAGGLICAIGIVAAFFIPMWPGKQQDEGPVMRPATPTAR